MLTSLFPKRKFRNICFINYDYHWQIDNSKIEFLFKSQLKEKLDLKYYYYDNEKYKSKEGLFHNLKINNEKLNSIYFNKSKGNSSDVFLSINLGEPYGPNEIFIQFPILFDIKIDEIIVLLTQMNFKIDYSYSFDSANLITLSYVFGVSRDFGKIFDVNRTSKQNLDDWRKNHKLILLGKLRDIFLINILNNNQLELIKEKFDDLNMLISRDKRYGKLNKLNGLNIWEVEKVNLPFLQMYFKTIMI